MGKPTRTLCALAALVMALGVVKGQAQPVLLSFSLNLNPPEELLLTFSSSVDASTCNVPAVTLQNSAALLQNGGFHMFLDGTCSSGSSSAVVQVNPTMDDWFAVQGNINLATHPANTFLSLGASFILDELGAGNVEISSSNAIPVTTFAVNGNPPILFGFGLDLNDGFLGLQFSEGINTTASNLTGIELTYTNATTNLPEVLGFSPSNRLMTFDPGVRVGVFFDPNTPQLFILKLALEPFALSIPAGSFVDANGMANAAAADVPPFGIFQDETPPELERFLSIDLNTGSLTLVFDEPMSLQSVNFSEVFLVGAMQDPSGGSSLSGSAVRSSDPYSTVLIVELSIDALNSVKSSNPAVCSIAANCFIFLGNSSFTDVTNNGILSSMEPLNGSYTQDITPPILISFSLDLDTGILDLTFSEPIEAATFNGSAVTIQNSVQSFTVLLASTTITSTESFSTVLLIDVSSVLNELKLLVNNFGSVIFLSMESNVATDTSGNFAVVIPPLNPLFVTAVTADITPPSMLSFMPSDPFNREIVFFFDEYVRTNSWNGNNVVLSLPTAQGTFNYSGLSQGVTNGSDMNSITYVFSSSEFVPPLSDHYSNSYFGGQFGIAAAAGLITDISDNPSMPSSLVYTSQIPDTLNPVLRSFSLDMNTGTISMTFSEAVNVTNSDTTLVTLQNSFTLMATQLYTLTGGTVSSPSSLDVVSISLTSLDLNSLKLLMSLATSLADTYLFVQLAFAADLSGNQLTAQSDGLQVSTFIPDMQGAVVVSFELDLDANVMSVQFDEPVRVSSFNLTGITLTDSDQFVNSVELQNVTLITSQDFVTNLVFRISMEDSFRVKDQPLCTNGTNCFAVFNAALIEDTNNNPSVSIETPLPIFIFTEDTTQPQFLNFFINMNTGMITLQFDEPILLDNAGFSLVYLTGTMQTSPSGYPLNDSIITTTEGSGTVLVVALSTSVLNAVKNDPTVCTFLSNCFLFLEEFSFFDTNGNPFSPPISGVLPFDLVPDMTPPSLVSFALDLDSGLVLLTFDEPVNVGSFNPSGISIINSDQTESVNLENAMVELRESFNTILGLSVETPVLNGIKAFVVANANVHITLQPLSVSDTNNNRIQLVSLQPVQSIVEDTTPPNMLQFIPSPPDMRRITFIFNEFVDSSSWNGTRLILSLSTSLGTFNYSAFTRGMFNSSDTDAFTYAFSEDEFILPFSTNYTIAYNSGLFELFTTLGLITDLNGNPLPAITMPLTFNDSLGDIVRPMLTEFALDLNTGTIIATFSEEISVLAVANRVTLQNSATQSMNFYTLQEEGLTTVDTMAIGVLLISIARSDLNILKLITMLATSEADTYIVLMPSFATDLSGNQLAPQTEGLQANSFIPDTEGPVVLIFELDLDADIMSIEFDEPVQVSSFDHTTITLIDSAVTSADIVTVQLMNVEVIHASSERVDVVRFVLGVNESVLIKSEPLCYTEANCFVTISNGIASDVYGNPSEGLAMPLQIGTLTPDVSPPRLVTFAEFDLDAGTFTLEFSEPVNTSTVQFADIQFINDEFNPTVNVTLTGGSTTPDHIVVAFILQNEDLNRIKLSPELCTDVANCWIRLPSFFINDIADVPFLHSNFGMSAEVEQPLSFIPDTTRPQVECFSVDLNIGNMVISFDEAILDTNFIPSDVTLLDSVSGSITLSLSTETTFLRSANGDALSLFFTLTDLNRLKSSVLYTSRVNSFLSITSTTLTDSSGNMLVNILATAALQASTYIPDVTSPILTLFDLFNIDNGTFIISFDEPVSITSVRSDLITFLSGPNSQENYTLTGGSSIEYRDDSELSLVLTLSNSDRTQLKLLSGLATSENSTFIAIEGGTVLDTAANPNVPILSAEPLQISSFVPDTSAAMLSSFRLDLNQGVLIFTFSDVVDVSSIDLTQLTIQNAQQIASEVTSLSSGSTNSQNSDVVEILLSEVDLNALKFNPLLAFDASSTFVSFTGNFARDIEGRSVIEITTTESLAVGLFIPDSSPPMLASFSLDMDSGTVDITFSEPVLTISIISTDIVFQNGFTASSDLMLRDATVQTSETTALTVAIALSFDSLNMLKSTPNVATSLSDTYINITNAFAVDTSLNSIEPTVQIASEYVPDTVPPEILYFDVNLTASPFESTLRIKFSEAVQYSSEVQTVISFRSSQTSAATTLQLTSQDQVSLPALDEIEIIIASVSASLSNSPFIGSSVNALFLSVSEGGVSDFNGNPAVVIPEESALRVRLLSRPCFQPRTYSNSTTGVCESCSSACVESCTGALPVAGDGGCNSCYIALLNTDGAQERCIAQSDRCPLGYYNSTALTPSLSNIIQSTCKPCHSECLQCTGSTSSECQACSSSYTFTPGTTGITECVPSCDGISLCQDCHAQCNGCNGPRSEDCVLCRDNELVVDSTLGLTVCVPSCPSEEYLARISTTEFEYDCRPCNDQCIGCMGPANIECLRCQNVNSTVAGVSRCLVECPQGEYNSNGLCLSCDSLCDGCSGPSALNCTACSEEAVQDVENGGCVSVCSFGQTYDSSINGCQLSQVAEIIIIVCGVVVGLILIVLVLIVILCLLRRNLKNKTKEPVLFISSTTPLEISTKL